MSKPEIAFSRAVLPPTAGVVLGGDALGEGVGRHVPKAFGGSPDERGLERVVRVRHVRVEVEDVAELGVRPAGLHAPGARLGNVEVGRTVQVSPDVPDVVDFENRAGTHLLLYAEVEVMVASHLELGRGRAQGGRGRGGEGLSPEKVGHGPALRQVVDAGLVEAERHHVVVHAPVRILLLEEAAVAAAQDRLVSERLPGEAETRPELCLVRAGDRQGQPGLAAGLDVVLEERIGRGPGELRPQVDLIGLAPHDDRSR